MKIDGLKNKKILILGFGREGFDSFVFLRKNFPDKLIAIADRKEITELDLKIEKILGKDGNIIYFGGPDYLKSLKNFDVILKTPGIRFEDIKKYLNKETTTVITAQTDLFFDNCPATIIGITGTKGKSTTSALINNMLKKSGKSSYLLGNIETPSLSYMPKIKKNDIVVYELSCHQLQFLEVSPHISVYLNIYPEHLDYYKTFKNYCDAKANIALHQKKNDYLIYDPKSKEISNIAKRSKAKLVPIDSGKYSKIFDKYLEFKEITHPNNIAVVFEIGKILKLKEEQIVKSIKSFKKLPHRLESVGEFKKIRFYDDSIATIPEATIFALDTLGKDVQTLIAGGFDRGIKFNKISARVSKSDIKNLILFPSSGKKIWEGIKKDKQKDIDCSFVDDMDVAVKKAYQKTQPNKICLLSCAAPSFGIFKDYKDRGDQFKKFVKQYGR
jgi:UDP-N-acetylmuramoylalanine--D-glutamate ligase